VGRGRPAAAIALLSVLAGGAGLTALLRWFWTSADPATSLIIQLKTAERKGFTLEVPGAPGPLHSTRARFDRLTVELDPVGGDGQAFVTATLDLEGKLEGGLEVHSLGYERVPFVRDGRGYRPAGGLAPTLALALRALVERRRALEEGDLAALARLRGSAPADSLVQGDPALRQLLALKGRRYRVSAWYLRLERDAALVTEEFRLEGTLPERPVDEKGSRRLHLERTPTGEFYFGQGLM
jgi:hypothetical protein